MNKNTTLFATLILCLGLYGINVNASERKEGSEQTYKEKAKVLGNKIKEGFIATSKVPGLTECISKGTTAYAGFTSEADQEKAESITEKYLLMGETENLDLDDMNAVYQFLIKKYNARVGQNIEKGSSYLGSSIVKGITKCMTFAGDKYYELRLAQALEWAYTNQVKDVGETGLVKIEELEKK